MTFPRNLFSALPGVAAAYILALSVITAPPLRAQTDSTTVAADTTAAAAPDTTAPKPPPQWLQTLLADTAKIKTRLISPDVLARGGAFEKPPETRIDSFHLWDEMWRVPGFAQSLGQVGKPYRVFRYGLTEQYLDGAGWTDPVLGAPSAYIWRADRDVRFFDTRTPYIAIDFAQSSRETQLLEIDLSRNVSPFWNAALRYRRRSAVGAYPNHLTDHYNVSFSNYFKSFNQRYRGFFSVVYNELNDNLNGGSFQDGAVPEEFLFEKQAQQTFLHFDRQGQTAPELYRRLRSVFTRHYYDAINDSTIRLRVFAHALAEDYDNQYTDETVFDSSRAEIWRNLRFSPYPEFYYAGAPVGPATWRDTISDTLFVQERYKYVRRELAGGALAELNVGIFGLKAGYEYRLEQLLTRSRPSLTFDNQNKNTQRIWGELRLERRLRLEGELRFSFNNLLPGEFGSRAAVEFAPLQRVAEIVDSTAIDTTNRWYYQEEPFKAKIPWTPFRLTGEYRFERRNPALYQAYFQGATFVALPERPQNEGLNHFRAEARLEGRPHVRRGFRLRQNYAKAGAFYSRLGAPVAFDSDMRPAQADGSYLQWLGLSIGGRLRWKILYAEGEATAQTPTSSGGLLSLYEERQPRFYGNARVYYENKIRRTQLTLYAGVEARFFSAFSPFLFNPAVQAFFPAESAEVPAYAAVDLVFSGQFGQRTFIFMKLLHLNEGWFRPGYFTTPNYPMLEQSFSFGVKWVFYD